jgi:hypothetical protein
VGRRRKKKSQVDWFAADSLGSKAWTGVLANIERGMLLPPIGTVTSYCNLMCAAGLRPIFMDDVSQECAKTWDISIGLISNPKTWALAAKMGPDAIAFLHAMHDMKAGFASGAFRFTMLIGEKPTLEQLEN